MLLTFLVALGSGLIGALTSAYLSYEVRLRAKRQEDGEERQRLAKVNFLLLTDTMAADYFIKDILTRLPHLKDEKENGYQNSHAIATWLAKQISNIQPEHIVEVKMLVRPIFRGSLAALDKFEIEPDDLGRMRENTIYAYHRYCTATARLKISMEFLDTFLDQENIKLLDHTILHGIFLSYRNFADSAGLLRAGLAENARLSNDYSVKCLVRSFNAIKEDVTKTFEHNVMLASAKKAAEETTSPTEK